MIASSDGRTLCSRVLRAAARAALVLRREEWRIDHHRRGEFVAEIMREPDRDAAAEGVPDDPRRPGLKRARRARPPAPRGRTGGNHRRRASPNAPCR